MASAVIPRIGGDARYTMEPLHHEMAAIGNSLTWLTRA